MSDCPGTVGKIAFHCPGCQENESLRAQLALTQEERDDLRERLGALQHYATQVEAQLAQAERHRDNAYQAMRSSPVTDTRNDDE